MISECNVAPGFRVMIDKPVTLRRERVGWQIGHLDEGHLEAEYRLRISTHVKASRLVPAPR